MRTFKVPLRIRMQRNARYMSDPAHRLAVVNRNRIRSGLTPYASVDDIPSYSELSKVAAGKRARKDDGTFA